jgi:hypothetical protein
MSRTQDQSLLEALLDSWDRNNTILINLLRALPEGGLEARVMGAARPSRGFLRTYTMYDWCSSPRMPPSSPETCPRRSGWTSATPIAWRKC